MTRSERIQPIKDIADTRERNAGAVVAQAERALHDRDDSPATAIVMRLVDIFLFGSATSGCLSG